MSDIQAEFDALCREMAAEAQERVADHCLDPDDLVRNEFWAWTLQRFPLATSPYMDPVDAERVWASIEAVKKELEARDAAKRELQWLAIRQDLDRIRWGGAR